MVRMWTFVDQCGNKTFSEQEIVVDEPALILPNAFSPGNNNYNDLYVIPNMYTEDTDEGQVPPCYWGGDNFHSASSLQPLGHPRVLPKPTRAPTPTTGTAGATTTMSSRTAPTSCS